VEANTCNIIAKIKLQTCCKYQGAFLWFEKDTAKYDLCPHGVLRVTLKERAGKDFFNVRYLHLDYRPSRAYGMVAEAPDVINANDSMIASKP